jgi:hypothetical protein
MTRRRFVFSATTFALLNGCGVLLGKPATPRVARVGILDSGAESPTTKDQIAGLKQALADLGYVDGQTIIFEQRDSQELELVPELANELAQLPVVHVCGDAAGTGRV